MKARRRRGCGPVGRGWELTLRTRKKVLGGGAIGHLRRGGLREGPSFGEAVSGQAISEEVGLGRDAFWVIASEEAGSGGGGGSEGTHLRGGGLRERRSLEEQPQRKQAQGEAGSEGAASEEAGPGRGGAWASGLRGGGLRDGV